MTPKKDVRWIQRFNNFEKALAQLRLAVELANQRELSNLEEQGLIQAFEYTYELAWNTMKDYFENQDGSTLYGSRDVFRLAFKRGLVDNGEFWMDMITSRTLTTHTYNQDTAEKIAKDVLAKYFGEFQKLYTKLTDLQKQIPL